ncbi:class I SAM-dependent DNA methyltransferase, partial [Candidatus Latescibacterota bacterium]
SFFQVNDRFGGSTNSGGGYSVTGNQSYTELAEIYDRIMDHVDYISWAQYLSSIFKYHNINVNSILEIACGTGNLSVELSKLGYSITGMDISQSMLANTAGKFKKINIPIKLFSSNMKTLPLRCQFDAVICIYDSINYMIESEDFIRVVVETSRITKPDGLFIFDVCTVKNSELFFLNNKFFEDFGGISYERICKFNTARRVQENHFIIKKNGKQTVESHYQKIYTIDEINEMIGKTQFKIVGLYDDMSFNPGTENSDRIHFVLQR